MLIPLTQNQTALIDIADSDLAKYKWTAQYSPTTDSFYAGRNNRSYGEKLHRIILSRMLGRPLLRTELTDHINGNTLDNRRDNLRLATHSQNSQNRKLGKNNTSGYKGVFLDKRSSKWWSEITANKITRFLGYYDTPEQAYKAYCEAAKLYHGKFKRLK